MHIFAVYTFEKNCIIPAEKLSPTPSEMDGLDQNVEAELRFLGCELIQTSGVLLRLPQVAMATAQVLLQRYYYSKSFIYHPVEIVAAAAISLGSKIEEATVQIRDVVNVFHHMKQIRTRKTFEPMLLNSDYVHLKSRIIRAELRILKELGFCVQMKHPHKFLLAFLGTLQLQNNHKMVQLAWNYMIDSYRTPVHLLYPPEAIACACIHLSARILQVPLPNKPAWYMVFDVLEDDLQKMCIEILSVYTFEKPDVEKLEIIVADVFKKQQVAKLKAKGLAALNDILMKNPLLSSSTSVSSSDGLSPNAEKENQDCNGIISLRMEEAKHQKRSRMDEANHQKMSKRSRQTSPSGDHHHSSSRKSYASRSSVHSHERIHHHSSSREKSYKYHHGSRSSVRSQEHLHHHSGSRGKLHKYQRAGRSPVYKHDRHHHSRSYTESRKSCYASPLTVHNHKHEHYSISLAR